MGNEEGKGQTPIGSGAELENRWHRYRIRDRRDTKVKDNRPFS
jgi:hypothetical protein